MSVRGLLVYAALDVMLEAASGAALDDPTQGALFEEQGASEWLGASLAIDRCKGRIVKDEIGA